MARLPVGPCRSRDCRRGTGRNCSGCLRGLRGRFDRCIGSPRPRGAGGRIVQNREFHRFSEWSFWKRTCHPRSSADAQVRRQNGGSGRCRPNRFRRRPGRFPYAASRLRHAASHVRFWQRQACAGGSSTSKARNDSNRLAYITHAHVWKPRFMTIKMSPSWERETQPVKQQCFSRNVAGLAPYTCWFGGVWVRTCPTTLSAVFMRPQTLWCTKVWRSPVFTVSADWKASVYGSSISTAMNRRTKQMAMKHCPYPLYLSL